MIIIIDWKSINAPEDFYSLFLPQVKAPEWHGHSLNALNDSMVNGDINGMSPPYKIKNINFSEFSGNLLEFKRGVMQVFVDSAMKHAGTEVLIE